MGKEIREYIQAMIDSGNEDITPEWIEWALKKADWYDPSIATEDTVEIFSKCGKENCFGRTIVEEITGLKPSGASKLIKLLVDSEVIVPVTGHGKGKYRFQ